MRLFLIGILFSFFSANAQVQVYNHTATYATNYNNGVYDLTIDSPYTWKFISYNAGGTTADVQVIFNVLFYDTPCRIFSRTYHLTGSGVFNCDTAVQRNIINILDPQRQNQTVVITCPSYPDYTGKIFMCAVNTGTHDPTVMINAAIGYGRSNTPLDTFTINGQHGISCSASVKNWIDSNVIFYPGYTSSAVIYAYLTHAVAVVCSNAGQAQAYSLYPTVEAFVPLGSNSYIDLTYPTSIPNAITSGASRADTNFTAYGPGLEFIAPSDVSSFSNGIIAGQLLKIYQARGHGWWDARYAARITASHAGVWDIHNGYGKIDVAAAIAYSGAIPPDPYL
jgi:hypothetical protein